MQLMVKTTDQKHALADVRAAAQKENHNDDNDDDGDDDDGDDDDGDDDDDEDEDASVSL